MNSRSEIRRLAVQNPDALVEEIERLRKDNAQVTNWLQLEREHHTKAEQKCVAVLAEIEKLRSMVKAAREALEGFAQPCTRQDYTFAKLDEVTMRLANNALAELDRLAAGGGE